MDRKRRLELSFANIICALTVIFIHISSEAIVTLNKQSFWYALIYFFWQGSQYVVFGFVFLSGIKQFLFVENFSAGKFYKKRIWKILIPYILWVGIYYAYDCIMGFKVFNIKEVLYYLYSGDYIGHFYFVVIIMQFYILMPFWIKLFKKINPKIMLPLAFIISIVFGQYLPDIISKATGGYYFRFADRTFTTYLFFWTAGAYIGLNYEKAAEAVKRHKWSIYLIFAVAAIITLVFGWYLSVNGAVFSPYRNIMAIYRIATVAALFAFSLAKANKVMNCSFMKILDLSSYNIYLCHILFMRITDKLLADYGVWDMMSRYIIRFIAVYTVSLGVCMLYTRIKKAVS